MQGSLNHQQLLIQGLGETNIGSAAMEHHLLLTAMKFKKNAAPQGHHHPGAGLGKVRRKGLSTQVVLFTDQQAFRLDLAKPQGGERDATRRIGRLG